MTLRRFLVVAFYGGERPPTISPARWRAMFATLDHCPEWILLQLLGDPHENHNRPLMGTRSPSIP